MQTGGNSSAIVDGAAAALVASSDYAEERTARRRSRASSPAPSVGVPPEIMGIGPVPAIKAVLERAGLTLADIDRFEINEAFGAQVMACARELGLDEDKLNVNGGAIAIGHPLGATGVRLPLTLARELKRAGLRYGIASACIGGGQGIALLIENPTQANGRTDHGHQGTGRDRHRRRAPASAPPPRARSPRPAPRSRSSTSTRRPPREVADEHQRHRHHLRRRRQRERPKRRSRRPPPTHGPARILVNCAGVGPAKRIVGRDGPMPLADYERVISINLIGTFNMMRLVAAAMQAAEPLADGERGVIVSTASVAAFEGQIGQAAYASSKGGVAALTLPAAREFAQFGIRVLRHRARHFRYADAARTAAGSAGILGASVPFPKRLGEPRGIRRARAAHASTTAISTARSSASTARCAWRRADNAD